MLNKILKLTRPLAVLDLETTGLNATKDRIIQVSITIHYPERDSIAWTSFVNPEISIFNSEHHHITDADVLGAPTFKVIAPALAPKITNVDIAGYNVNFDIGFMHAEMRRAGVVWNWTGVIIDPLLIYRMKHPHSLTNAYKQYVNQLGFKDAHNAANDVKATEEVLAAQLAQFEDLPRTVKELSEFCVTKVANSLDSAGKFIWVGTDCVINFGGARGHKGKKIQDIPKPYLEWMLTGDFSKEVKDIVQNALDGIYPTK